MNSRHGCVLTHDQSVSPQSPDVVHVEVNIIL